MKVSFVIGLFLPEKLFQDSNQSQNTERNTEFLHLLQVDYSIYY